MPEGVQIVHPVGISNTLLIGAVFHRLFEAGVQIADLRDDTGDAFAVHVYDQSQHTVGARVLRADVNTHIFGLKVRLIVRAGNARNCADIGTNRH